MNPSDAARIDEADAMAPTLADQIMAERCAFLTPQEAAARLDVSVATIRRAIHARSLPAKWLNKRVCRIPVDKFEAWSQSANTKAPDRRAGR